MVPGSIPDAIARRRAEHPVIYLQNVSRVYGVGEASVRACDRLTLSIKRGEYCAIMGQSGSGKTTLMNIIGCLDRPTDGQYFLDGTDVSHIGKNQLARLRNQKIGFVFQRYELLKNLTALENVMLPMMYAGIGGHLRRRRAAAALSRMGLGHRLDKRPSQLSGGQQQRVAIARAIVNRPLLLLADEPTGALDTQSAQDVMAIFDELHAGSITVVLVTHDVEVARHSKRIIHVRDGRIVESQSQRLTGSSNHSRRQSD